MGGTWHTELRGPRTALKVRERNLRSSSASGDSDPRRLTSRIKDARKPIDFLALLNQMADKPIFNHFHASAAYHRLAEFHRDDIVSPADAESPGILKLHACVKKLIVQGRMDIRGLANVFWAMAYVPDEDLVEQLLPDFVQAFECKAHEMNGFDLSNCLWASARMKGITPDMKNILPPLLAQIPRKAAKMNPQLLANSVWAVDQWKNVTLVREKCREIMPELLVQIPDQLAGMRTQELSNILSALTDFSVSMELGSSGGSAISIASLMKLAVKQFIQKMGDLHGKDLAFSVPVAVWACAMSRIYEEELLRLVEELMKIGGRLSSLPDWGVCVLAWSYPILDQTGRFGEFQQTLEEEVARRGLSQSDIERSQEGYGRWEADKQ